ncbi:Flagellar hook-length control protein [Vibrio thalassae]|uniref:Flagellar hook-length control protein n=1 Tax=Vibrio thalassae TaxID=1243014 RepID=A0A240ER49_9VIBR|nr:flagellar hook-length control protein FliK [Vibrio thalassae]SNX50585.1 Flagellar hook-length control protein [Vibrio thalassae]
MSLAITNNSISATPNTKSSDKTTVVDSADNAEQSGFFDTLKNAISSENTEEKQKAEGRLGVEAANSHAIEASLGEEDAEVLSTTAQEAESLTPAAGAKSQTETSVDEDPDESVKNMAPESAVVVSSHRDTLNLASEGSVEAKKTVSDSAQLLSRLDESNSALKPKNNAALSQTESDLSDAAVLGAATASTQHPKRVEPLGEPTIPLDINSSSLTQQHQNSPETNAATDDMATEQIAVLTGASGSTMQTATGLETKAINVDGESKNSTQSQIAWTKANAEHATKIDPKSLVATTVAADKLHSSHGPGAALTASAPLASTLPVNSASHSSSDVALTASMLATNTSVEHSQVNHPTLSTAGASFTGVQKPSAMTGLGQVNELPEGITHAATGATANQLRAEQSQPPTNVQSPLMLTKDNASDQVAERVQMMMAKNLKHVDIRLDPPDLGRMQIRMSLNNDSATVHFTVQNQHTRDMVDQAMPRLREMLSQQGIQLADSSVQQQSQGQQQRHASQESGGSGSHANGRTHQGLDESEQGVNLEVNIAKKTDGISYYA